MEGELISHFFPTPAGPWRPLVSRRGRDLGNLPVSLKHWWLLRGRMCPAIPRVLRGGWHEGGVARALLEDTGSIDGLPSPVVFRNGSSGGHRTYIVGRCFATAHRYRMHLTVTVPTGHSAPTQFPISNPCHPCGAVLGYEARDVDSDVSDRIRPSNLNFNRLRPEFLRVPPRAIRTIGLAINKKVGRPWQSRT